MGPRARPADARAAPAHPASGRERGALWDALPEQP
jgi:hypothetical protein